LLMLVGSDCISSQKAFIIIIILLWFLSFSIFFGNMREHIKDDEGKEGTEEE